MPAQTITAKGQITLKRDLLQHLGITPGERIEFEKLPNGEIRLRAARPAATIEPFLGLLAGKTSKIATLQELDEAAAASWSAKR
ncbi:AbrB/MazE/SpoVT family DNA-binding domain-containing protein [Acidiphilium sp.]|uniref:AbrB/MazE/SpoVT family DNA-binding domain-containing protein n=1 Tax=Acidiphilium sp. TaxID=527 RepID=UPI003CFF924E